MGLNAEKEEELGWSHLTLPPTLDLGSQVVLGIGCSLTILGSDGFLITLATSKSTVVYPRSPALPICIPSSGYEHSHPLAFFGQHGSPPANDSLELVQTWGSTTSDNIMGRCGAGKPRFSEWRKRPFI